MELELNHAGEHFVKRVAIDGDSVSIECSCSWVTKDYSTEAEARESYDEHYESVMH